MIQHFKKNTLGKDYVVGDIHGCFSLLQQKLSEICFDENVDRLFSVGDLVDRGPESEAALSWLEKPWFHAVRGNHEQMAIDFCSNKSDGLMYAINGGQWFMKLTEKEHREFHYAFSGMPVAIEVETENGLVGIVHADCPTKSWQDLHTALTDHNSESYINMCIWSRDRIQGYTKGFVEGVYKVYVGHTPVDEVVTLENVVYIDTGAVFGKTLTVVRIN